MARLIGITLTLALCTAGGVTADTWFAHPAAELVKTAESARVSRVVFLTDVDLQRFQVQRALAGGSESEALLALEKFISALIEERDGAHKRHHQLASNLLKIEKLKGELAQAHLKYGEISRRLSHNRKSEISSLKRFENANALGGLAFAFNPDVTQVTLVKRALPPTSNQKDMEDLTLMFSSVEASRPFDEADLIKQRVMLAIGLGNDGDALSTLETLAATLRERRDRLAPGHGQQADRLAVFRQVQDALGRAHLDCGLLGQVIQARGDVARVVAESAAGRATQADLAAARARLADAETRMAAEGVLCGRWEKS